MNKRQMKKQAKINNGRKLVETNEGLKLEPAKEIYLEEDVAFDDSDPFFEETLQMIDRYDEVITAEEAKKIAEVTDVLEAHVASMKKEKERQLGDPKSSITINSDSINLTGHVIETDSEVVESKDELNHLKNPRKVKEMIDEALSKGCISATPEEPEKDLSELQKEVLFGNANVKLDELYTLEDVMNGKEKAVERINAGTIDANEFISIKVNSLSEDLKKELQVKQNELDESDFKELLVILNSEPKKPKGFIAKIKNFFKKG